MTNAGLLISWCKLNKVRVACADVKCRLKKGRGGGASPHGVLDDTMCLTSVQEIMSLSLLL